MEARHDLPSGLTELILEPADLETFNTQGLVSAQNPHTGRPVEVFRIPKMIADGQDDPERSAPSASFNPDSLLNIAVPLSREDTLSLPITIPSEAITECPSKEYYIGKAGRIVIREATRSEAE